VERKPYAVDVSRGSTRGSGRGTKADVAKDVWTEFLGYFFAHRERTFGAVTELGLTPGHMKALFELGPDAGCSMSELANTLHCDASNATWLVDRLEERGLVERRPHPRDRRVKSVVLTPAGVEMKQRLVEKLSEPPTDLVALDREALEQLRAALEHLPAHPPFWAPTPGEACPMEDAV
jgi:DNA-binding MarR family transcriptional regulator